MLFLFLNIIILETINYNRFHGLKVVLCHLEEIIYN